MFDISNSHDFWFSGKNLDISQIESKIRKYSEKNHIRISRIKPDSIEPEKYWFDFDYGDDEKREEIIIELKKIIGIRF